jgi:hypothetical protein
VVNINSGGVGDDFEVSTGSEVNIRGGSVGDNFVANGSVNLFGRDFLLDGVTLDDGLEIGDTLTINDRDVTLSGQFADGTPFSFELNSTSPAEGGDIFAPNAALSVTLIIILGDANQDKAVNFSDIPPFIELLLSGGFLEEADINRDGEVNFMDIEPFIEILIAG